MLGMKRSMDRWIMVAVYVIESSCVMKMLSSETLVGSRRRWRRFTTVEASALEALCDIGCH